MELFKKRYVALFASLLICFTALAGCSNVQAATYADVRFWVDGQIKQTVSVVSGEKIAQDDIYVPDDKQGYDFIDWCVDSEFVTFYDYGEVNEDLDLYAKFEVKDNSDPGTGNNPDPGNYGGDPDSGNPPDDPDKDDDDDKDKQPDGDPDKPDGPDKDVDKDPSDPRPSFEYRDVINPENPLEKYQVIELGRYPTDYVGNALNEELNDLLETASNRLLTTGNFFQMLIHSGEAASSHTEYYFDDEENGGFYAVMQPGTFASFANTTELSNGQQTGMFFPYISRWFKVEPITWIVTGSGNDDNGEYIDLLSESIIAGVEFGKVPNWSDQYIEDWLANGFINAVQIESYSYATCMPYAESLDLPGFALSASVTDFAIVNGATDEWVSSCNDGSIEVVNSDADIIWKPVGSYGFSSCGLRSALRLYL